MKIQITRETRCMYRVTLIDNEGMLGWQRECGYALTRRGAERKGRRVLAAEKRRARWQADAWTIE